MEEHRMRRVTVRSVLLAVASTVALLTAAAPHAGAVVPGPNGRIVFTSGRAAPDGDDSQAKLYLRTILSGTGFGTTGATITPRDGVVHRHPAWSPDRTHIAYAAGKAATQDYDIFTLDLTLPGAVPQNMTNSPGVTEDRPAWSPDGTRLIYDSEVTDGSNQSDLIVTFPAGGVPPRNLTAGTPTTYETKAAWTPDGQTVYYASGDVANTNTTILKEPAAGGTVTPGVSNTPMLSEFQPAISPDGTRVCYTIGTGFNNTVDIVVASLANPTLAQVISKDPTHGDLNCVFSPDGTRLAYVNGIFGEGALVMANLDGSNLTVLEDDLGNFDGNPDWAPDGSPTCEAGTVTVTAGVPTAIPLICADSGPTYEQRPVTETTGCASCTDPARGTLGTVQQGTPSTVTYTPNAGFTGADSFVFSGSDGTSSATPATVTVTVVPAPASPPVPTGGPAGGGGGVGGGAVGPPEGAPPFAAKLEVARARVIPASRGSLDVLAPITARASGTLRVAFQAAGRTERFTAPVDAARARVRIARRLPTAQARLGTGILTLTYPGDADTQPQEVRLRAAPRAAGLVAGRPKISANRLTASGRVSSAARGVVRVQVLYEPAGQPTRTLEFTARIAGGRYRVDVPLAPDVLKELALRRGVVHSYTLFTGYRPARMRGELASFQVLGGR